MLGVVDDVSLIIIDRNGEHLVQELNKLKFGFGHLQCLEILYRGEKDIEKDLIFCSMVKRLLVMMK